MLAAVPEGIWGVLIGSSLAFGGTYVATRQQLRHDTEQRERERKMQLRRDVFLEAAEAVAGTTEFFMKFANLDIGFGELTPQQSRPGWLNKLYTVASLDAIEAFTAASAALGAATFDLLQHRVAIQAVADKVSTLHERIDVLKRVQEQIRETSNETARVAATPEVVQAREVLERHWADSSNELETLWSESAMLWDRKAKLQRELVEQAVSHSLTYQRKLRRALVALRRELDLPIDEVRFEQFMSELEAEMLPKFKHLLDAVEADGDTAA